MASIWGKDFGGLHRKADTEGRFCSDTLEEMSGNKYYMLCKFKADLQKPSLSSGPTKAYEGKLHPPPAHYHGAKVMLRLFISTTMKWSG